MKGNKPPWFIVFAQEFRMIAGTRSFRITTLLGPFLLVAVAILPTLISMRSFSAPATASIGITHEAAAMEYLEQALTRSGLTVAVIDTMKNLNNAVEDGELDGWLGMTGTGTSPGAVYITADNPDVRTMGMLESAFNDSVRRGRLEQFGLTGDDWNELSARAPVLFSDTESWADDGIEDVGGISQDDSFLRTFMPNLAFIMMVYMTILMYGNTIGRSAVREKSSRTVEVLLSSVTSGDLMKGKLLGTVTAGLVQYGAWFIISGVIITLFDDRLGFSLTEMIDPAFPVLMVCGYLLGFFLYGSAYLSVGAAVEDDLQLSQMTFPLIAILILPLLGISGIIAAPDGAFAAALSIFPGTAPLVMPVRIMTGSPALWEISLSLLLVLGSIAGLTALSAKVFRVGILMTGRKFGFRDIAAWIRM